MVPYLQDLGHDVAAVDLGWFDRWRWDQLKGNLPRADIRELTLAVLENVDSVVHLAALSNDPLGALDAALTAEINLESTVRLATLARQAGVKKFIFASSCSIYGAAGSAWVEEGSDPKPLTQYACSKWAAEKQLLALATDGFSPVVLRLATVYGLSPSMRLDLVANNLTAWAVAVGEVRLHSDGQAWRPLVHVRDVARVIAAVLAAPAETVGGEVINVGSEEGNYLVREIAEAVCAAVPEARLVVAPHAPVDERSYRVRFGKLCRLLPCAVPAVRLAEGLRELVQELRRRQLDAESMTSGRFFRTVQLRDLQRARLLDHSLRWHRSRSTRPSSGSSLTE